MVFPHWRKSKADGDIIFKQYVMNTGVFHFGPLLCGKSRDWYVLPAPSEHPDVLPVQSEMLGWGLQGLVLLVRPGRHAWKHVVPVAQFRAGPGSDLGGAWG